MLKYYCQLDSIKKHVRFVSIHKGIFRDSWAIGALIERADESLDGSQHGRRHHWDVVGVRGGALMEEGGLGDRSPRISCPSESTALCFMAIKMQTDLPHHEFSTITV